MPDHGQRGWAPEVIGDVGERDSDVYTIGIRDSEATDSWSLMFMEPFDAEDPQEVDLGMDTYYLAVDPGQATCYGGVRECALQGQRLDLTLTPEAADTLGICRRR